MITCSATVLRYDKHECRLADELKQLHSNDVKVIDIAKLSEDKHAFVFGDALRTIYITSSS